MRRDETQYWFELLFHTDYFTEEEYISINTDVDELISMLTSVIKTSKNRIKTNINLELS